MKRNAYVCSVVLSILLWSAAHAVGWEASAWTQQRAAEAYRNLPMSFEANQGQTDKSVRFLSRGPGYTLFLGATEAVLVAAKSKPRELRMKLIGSNPTPEVRGVEELPSKSYYFVGKDPENWRSKVPNYARVRYEGVYPGVDLVYYGNQQQLEYDFLVAPRADPKSILLSFPGAQELHIDPQSGDLRVICASGEARLHRPVAYQSGDKLVIAAQYVLKPGMQAGIEVGSYDTAKPLTIDPVLTLSYSTYLGGSDGDTPAGIAVDSSGNAYVTGYTASVDFPTVHPLPSSIGPIGPFERIAPFVSKLSFDTATSTLSLAWSTYLGGSRGRGLGIAVDSSGNAYVTGVTSSPDFPTVHGLPAPVNFEEGISDAFVSKLTFDSATSTLSLAWSTKLGGSLWEDPDNQSFWGGIAVDASGDAYVTGTTLSGDFPMHPDVGRACTASAGGAAYVSKLRFDDASSTLSLVWSTCLGGNLGFNFGKGIAVDSSGNAYVTGVTGSPDFPTVHSLPSPNNALQGTDAFVSKLSFDPASSTLSLVWSTFLGGSDREGFIPTRPVGGIAVDSSGNAYVTGVTYSSDFPTVHGLPPPVDIGAFFSDVFELSFNSTTSSLSLAWSTKLGGTADDISFGIAIDSSGNAYVTGRGSFDFPNTNPLPAPSSGNQAVECGSEIFVSMLSFDNQTSTLSLPWSTCLGTGLGISGSGGQGIGIAVDRFRNVYVTGYTLLTDFPTVHSLPPPNDMLQGPSDAFVSKLTFGIGPPTDKNQCKKGGWKIFTIPRKFKNQGDCVRFVETGG